VGLAAALALSAAGCAKKQEEAVMDPTVTVETTRARLGSLSTDGSYIGTISAEGTAQVLSLVSGTVEKVGVAVGDTVKAGEFLCHIDDESARLNLDSAKATYQTALTGLSAAQAGMSSAQAGSQQAQAAAESAQESYKSALAQYGGSEDSGTLPVLEEQVRLAESNYDNTKALFDIGAASQIEVDQAYQTMLSAQAGLEAAKAGLSSAQAGVSQAQAGLASAEAGHASAQAGMEQAQASVAAARVGVAAAEYQLTLYDLTAPISGVVEAVNVMENNFAASGSPAFVISNGNNKTVTFYVTDDVRQTLTVGQSVRVSSSGKEYQGAVTEVSGVVDATAGLFKIKAVIDNAQDLPDGLVVELSTTAYAVSEAILIPSDALYFEDGNAYVYVARDAAAARVDVTVGLYTADTIAVTGGLSEGEEVITSWSAALKDAAPIRVAPEA